MQAKYRDGKMASNGPGILALLTALPLVFFFEGARARSLDHSIHHDSKDFNIVHIV